MKRVFLLGLLAVGGSALASPYFGSGALTTSDPTFVNPGGSTAGTGRHYYDVFAFSVSISGSYTIEMSSLNTSPVGSTSNALDTYLRIYATTFNPASPGAGLLSNDDFTGTLTVLPGPYTGAGLTSAATGFQNKQPSSRILPSLTAGTNYFLVLTSFRATDYIPSAITNPEAGAKGPYWFGISGQGDVIPAVPEPATLAVLGIGAAALLRRRKK